MPRGIGIHTTYFRDVSESMAHLAEYILNALA